MIDLVERVEMDPAEALEHLRSLRVALRRGHVDGEYEAAMTAYAALAEGTPIVRYGPAIENAPRDDWHRPRLAIARADQTQVQFTWHHGPWATFRTGAFDSMRWPPDDSLLVRRIHMGEGHGEVVTYAKGLPSEWTTTECIRGYALVPMVPADALIACGGRSRLRNLLILWEVEEWAAQPLEAVPDRDPWLLRPLVGDLCAVVAEWDLTDLERAIMARRTAR